MGLFSSLEKLGKAALGTALLPVDIVRECIPGDDDEELGDKVVRRCKKIGRNLEEAIDEIDK